MPKNSERGSVVIFLSLIFLVVAIGASIGVYKMITDSTDKISQTSEDLAVALKSDYQNPFEEETQYVNPFDEYQNPFDNLK